MNRETKEYHYGSSSRSFGTNSQNLPARLNAIRREQGFEVISEPSGSGGNSNVTGPTYVVGGANGGHASKKGTLSMGIWDRDNKTVLGGGSDSDIELVSSPGSGGGLADHSNQSSKF